MSDVAVTWAKAQVCLSKSGKPDRSAKQVLVHMASYADAAGEAWVLVDVLKMEMDVEYRTVERGRAALVAAGLLIKTEKTRVHRGKRIPVYRLPLEIGHASTVRRILAERAEASPVTHDGGRDALGASPMTGENCTDDGARGVTGDAQIGKEKDQELTLSACASEAEVDRDVAAAVKAWASKAPERVSPVRTARAWVEAMDGTGRTSGQLLVAVRAAVARDPDFGRGKAMNLDRWLADGRFEGWLVEGEAGTVAPRAGWAGPDDVREVVAAVMQPGPMASYFEPARWDDERRTVVVRTRFAADKLAEMAGRALSAVGVSVECERRA
jgi:hypothetical protein